MHDSKDPVFYRVLFFYWLILPLWRVYIIREKKEVTHVIRIIDAHNPETAQDILRIQIPAYQIEAALIDFDGIPPLKDTVDSIQ
ncbi:hypothetical protein BRIN106911_01455 [Brevibacillus invocatus]